jgi:2,4-dienoyl-CoA reductase-like NADH-dependent reductase (Old Yellow Enzyme family)
VDDDRALSDGSRFVDNRASPSVVSPVFLQVILHMNPSSARAADPVVFEPFVINALTVRNRIFVPAHTTNFGADHLPTRRHVEYHRERARGGVGLIIFEAIRVMENTLGRPQGVAGYTPEAVDAFRPVADAIHSEGAAFIAQICHMGRQIEGEYERTCSWSASSLRWSLGAYPPREMSRPDMNQVIDGHLRTAEHMIRAGADGIELHWGHGHLLQQFLSPLSNQRTDDYGGSIERRMRFPLEVLRRLRQELGPSACLGIRLSAEEYVPEGLTLEQAREIAARAAHEVQIDFIHVTHSAYHMSRSLGTQMADMGVDGSPFRELPGAIREATAQARHRPAILTVCKYRGLDEAGEMIRRGDADLVGLARAHLAEPELVRKWREGRVDEVTPCIGCNQGCAQNLEKNIALTCFVNPRAGRESQWRKPELEPARAVREVWVVGGGPAGLEAAATAAARGHRVTLLEREGRLGGRLSLAAGLRLREDFGLWLDFAQRRLERLGVEVRLGQDASPESLMATGVERIILATGAQPVAWQLPNGAPALTLDEAAVGDFSGRAIAVYDETGDWGALGLVEHLSASGASVTVLTPGAAVLWRTTIYSSTTTFARWRDRKIRLRPLRRPVALRLGEGLEVEDTSCGEREILSGIDALIACVPPRVSNPLEAPLRAAGLDVQLVGDCMAPRNALEAIFEGHRAARAF